MAKGFLDIMRKKQKREQQRKDIKSGKRDPEYIEKLSGSQKRLAKAIYDANQKKKKNK